MPYMKYQKGVQCYINNTFDIDQRFTKQSIKLHQEHKDISCIINGYNLIIIGIILFLEDLEVYDI